MRVTARRRPSRAVRGLVALATAAVAGVLATTAVASAARMDVAGGSLTSFVAGHPCAGSATTTAGPVTGGSATAVAVTPPAGCAGRPLQVTVLSGSTVLASGAATVAASGATSVPVGAYAPSASLTVRAVVDGWALPTTWSYSPPGNPFGTCTVVNTTGNPIAGQTCSVTDLRMGTSWGADGSRTANMYVSFSSTGVNGNQRVQFSLNLQGAQGVPAGWNWSTSGSLSGGNISTLSGYACSELPVLRGQTPPGWGSYTSVFFQVTENRATASNLSCS